LASAFTDYEFFQTNADVVIDGMVLARVAQRIWRTSFSAGTCVGGVEDFWLLVTLVAVTVSRSFSLP